MINENWIYLTLLINGFGTMLYVIGTLKGSVRPNRVTWGILALAPLIAGASMLSQGVSVAGAFYTFLTGLGPLAICISTFFARYPAWEVRRFDVICGLLSLFGLGLWLLTGEGLVAIAFAIGADGLAFLPTLVKAWRYPETEEVRTYTLSFLSACINMLIITDWTAAHVGFPAYILLVDALAAAFILRGKVQLILRQKLRRP